MKQQGIGSNEKVDRDVSVARRGKVDSVESRFETRTTWKKQL